MGLLKVLGTIIGILIEYSLTNNNCRKGGECRNIKLGNENFRVCIFDNQQSKKK